jgi:WD40 repeat protein
VLSAAHSAAGLSVLGSEDGVLKSWEIASGELSGSFSGGAGGLYGEEFGPGSLPTALGFDGEGGMLAAGFADGSVRLYEPASGGDLAGAPGAGSPVRAVAVDATGGTVAWTDDSFSGTPRVWDGDAASAPATLETGLWGVSRAKFRQSDGVLVLAGHWYGVPALDLRQAGSPWDSIGWWMAPLDGSLELDTGNAVADLLLSEDGGVVFAGGRGFVLALDLATLAEGDEEASADYGVLEGHDVVAMALLPGGERFVSAGREGRLVVWDSQTLQPVAAMETGGEPLALHWDEGTGRLVLVEADGPLRLIGCGLAE